MNPIRPEELSALIDSELDLQRAGELHERVAADPVLRAHFEVLDQLDAKCRVAGRTARFVPVIDLSADRNPKVDTLMIGLAVMLLLAIRFVTKIIEGPEWIWALNSVAFAAVIVAGMWACYQPSGLRRNDVDSMIVGGRRVSQ